MNFKTAVSLTDIQNQEIRGECLCKECMRVWAEVRQEVSKHRGDWAACTSSSQLYHGRARCSSRELGEPLHASAAASQRREIYKTLADSSCFN